MTSFASFHGQDYSKKIRDESESSSALGREARRHSSQTRSARLMLPPCSTEAYTPTLTLL